MRLGKSISPRELRGWLPARRSDAHKGDFGHVLIVAGSRGMAGAAILAARAACRSGAGLVTAAVPESLQPVVAGRVPEALTIGLPETAEGAFAAVAGACLVRELKRKNWDVVAIGPGLGTSAQTARAVMTLLGALDLPAVVDADGLNILARLPEAKLRGMLRRRRDALVWTPHPGEAARLLRTTSASVNAWREESAARLAALAGVCVLKGRGTIVADRRRRSANPTGNAGLAKGGTGDVLTGLLAGLWAQRLRADPRDGGFEAAALACWLHGAAGDSAARAKTARALLASDVIEALPDAFRRLG